MIIDSINGFNLHQDGQFFYVGLGNETMSTAMVNTSGNKEEVIDELERWKIEVDYNNVFMLDVENQFICTLKNIH